MSASTAVRVHESLLAAAEKKALIWMAQRLPGWVNSDHLTGLGITSMLAAGVAYWLAGGEPLWLWAVNLLLVANWFGDSLDGTLARVRNRQRPRYGYYVDHVVDVLGISFLMGGLALSGIMAPAVAAVFLVSYLLLSCEVYLATHSLNKFQISFFKFGPTELRILLIAGNLFQLYMTPRIDVDGRVFSLFDVGFACGAGGVLAVFAVMTAKHTKQLYEEERLD
jgi:archaetidylinositol phosphate synthase